jgi:hypothetical protein
MAIPQAFLDILNSLQILPLPRAHPGDVVKPQINKDLSTVFDPLKQVETLATLSLNILLENIKLAVIAGKDNLEIVLKAVEFTTPVDGVTASALDTAEPAKDKLAYTIPTSVAGSIVPVLGSLVEGLLGKITSEVSSAGSIAGSIAGTIAGDITTPAILTSVSLPTVSWRIQDDRGNPLQRGNDYVVDVTSDLTSVTPLFALMPAFVELSNPAADVVARRFLFCDLTFSDINGKLANPFNYSIGPATLDVVQAQLPTLVAMTQNALGMDPTKPAMGFPGLTMVALPASSVLGALSAVAAPLQAVKSTMSNVALLAGLAPNFTLSATEKALVGIFQGSANLIGGLLTAVSSVIDPNAFVIADQIMSFNNVEVSSGGCGLFGWFPCNMNDETSAILLVGPPTRSISCFNRYNLWTAAGAFTLTIGIEAAALAGDLSVSPALGTLAGTTVSATPVPAPPAGLMLSTLTVNTPANSGNPFHNARTFDNMISSMQFNPV